MNIFESIKTAVSSVFSSKLRAFLTMLGIIIGISSVITIVSLGAGMSNFMEEQWATMGLGNIQVRLSGWGDSVTDLDLLNMNDVEQVRHIPGVRTAAALLPSWDFQMRTQDPGEVRNSTINGITPEYEQIMHVQMLYGRYISQMDIDNAMHFAVITDSTADRIFGGVHAGIIGQTVEFQSWWAAGVQRFTVVGIMANPNAQWEDMMEPEWIREEVSVPITTLQGILGQRQVDTIFVAVEDPNRMTEIGEQVMNMLDNSRGTSGNYTVFNPMDFLEQMNAQLAMVTIAISGIAAISLLVGGIGVMNIMLVTVTERTREIGIRKSIGARNSDIRWQFLTEAIILTLIGGAIGIALGFAGGRLIGPVMNVHAVVDITSVVLAVGVSCLTGIVFGVGPAIKASKLDPIEALRYE
ncbi:MAG: ABC transporter permease [Defluviitaleaceae bacterium]|nr:ABC transporter permease [Defluviitaleaceae bacterium]